MFVPYKDVADSYDVLYVPQIKVEWVGEPGRVEGRKRFYSKVLINKQHEVCPCNEVALYYYGLGSLLLLSRCVWGTLSLCVQMLLMILCTLHGCATCGRRQESVRCSTDSGSVGALILSWERQEIHVSCLQWTSVMTTPWEPSWTKSR